MAEAASASACARAGDPVAQRRMGLRAQRRFGYPRPVNRPTASAAFLSIALLALSGCSTEEIAPVCAPDSAGCQAVFPGLTAEVRILRDAMGVVHIYGSADADVFFGSGYAQAADRLFQMDLMRRRALGRSAEVLGPDAASDDELIRTVNLPRLGRENADLLRAERPETYALIVAWTAGVNQRIDEVRAGRAPLPYGFGPAELDYMPEPWTPEDAIAIGKLILFGNANAIEYEILASILRDYFPSIAATPLYAPLLPAFIVPPEERPVAGMQPLSFHGGPQGPAKPLPPDAAERLAAFSQRVAHIRPGGSNNFAIDGRHTETGTPIIAGDPHQPLRSPSLMWVHHMNSVDGGGTIDAAGFSFVGVPGVQLGHNQHVAWTATTNYPDTMDLWGVVVDGGVAHLGGQDVPVSVRTESIAVRGEPDRTIEVVDVPGRGVLLPDGLAPLPVVPLGQRLLLGWPGFDPTHDVDAFFGMSSAEDLDAFEAGVDRMEIGNFNFVSASADGISYRSSAKLPDRGPPDDARAPYAVLDGADPASQWSGAFVPIDQMPHSRGGQRGWIASANNDPFGFTSDGKLAGDAFYFGVFFDPGTRAARIEGEIERLIGEGKVTVAGAEAIQTDTYSLLADQLVPLLEQIYATVDTDDTLIDYRQRPDLAQLVADISAWDRRMDRASPPALAYHAFMHFLTRRAMGDDFGLVFDPIANESPIYMLKFAILALTGAYTGSDALLQEGKPLLVMQALDETAAFLTSRFGSTAAGAYTWADFHETHFGSLWGEALDGGAVPTNGADGTVNVSAASFFQGGAAAEKLLSGAGPIYRFVATFDGDGIPRAEINYPRGNSGDPASPHWDDTLDDWVEGRYRPLLFRTDEVLADSTEEILLEP